MDKEYKIIKRFDTTVSKSTRIEFLSRMVKEASTILSMAEAKSASLANKADIFSELYHEAETNLQTAEAYWKMFLQIKSELEALTEIANEANLIAANAFYDIKQLVNSWEAVTIETIKAAEAITLTANYIQKRKASNPLTSNDLVNDAIAASKAAQKTVSKVLYAFSSLLRALAPSKQANNTTELTNVHIDEASVVLLEKDVTAELEKYKREGKLPIELIIEVQQSISDKQSLEYSLKSNLQVAKRRVNLALNASNFVNKELDKAKEEEGQAKVTLDGWKADLSTTEMAVAG